ncbi:unnamed protein product, partial [Ectocarpus sp. 8 AP-2014]
LLTPPRRSAWSPGVWRAKHPSTHTRTPPARWCFIVGITWTGSRRKSVKSRWTSGLFTITQPFSSAHAPSATKPSSRLQLHYAHPQDLHVPWSCSKTLNTLCYTLLP